MTYGFSAFRIPERHVGRTEKRRVAKLLKARRSGTEVVSIAKLLFCSYERYYKPHLHFAGQVYLANILASYLLRVTISAFC